MSYKLKKDNPLYGKEGCLISSRTYSLLPDKHKDLFINSNSNTFEQFDQHLREIMNDGIHRIQINPRVVRYRGGIPVDVENNIQEVEEVHHDDDDDDDFDLDMLEEDFEDDDDEEEDF